MKRSNKTFSKWLRAGIVFSVLTLTLSWLAGGPKQELSQENVALSGWGAESLTVVHDGLRMISPIALANACGMGASSCFKCHNGKRAAAPDMDGGKAPWHAQHKTVNNSCVGCHKGNPRIMKEDMAHKGMLNAPKSGVQSCATCHKSDQAQVESKYK